MSQFISVVIPAFNEERRLPSTLATIQAYLSATGWDFEIVVVDDGSHDRTSEVAKHAGARVLRNSVNRGKGYSVRRGMLAATGDLTLFSDADLSAPIEELDTLWRCMERAGADCTIGSRALDRSLIGVRQPIYREIMGRVFNALMRFETGLQFRDTQCGFKLFKSEVARQIFGLQRLDGFGFDVEVLYIAERLGYQIMEVAIQWNDVRGTKVSLLHGAKSFLDPLIVRWNWFTGKYYPAEAHKHKYSPSKGS